MLNKPKFAEFLEYIEENHFDTNITSTGAATIQQSRRNELRQQGVTALLEDLVNLYGEWGFDVVETKEGIVIVAENSEFTFSWELKNTIKSLDYDPFIAANNYEDAKKNKAAAEELKHAGKKTAANELEERRRKKLEEVAAKNNTNQE